MLRTVKKVQFRDYKLDNLSTQLFSLKNENFLLSDRLLDCNGLASTFDTLYTHSLRQDTLIDLWKLKYITAEDKLDEARGENLKLRRKSEFWRPVNIAKNSSIVAVLVYLAIKLIP